MASNRSRRLRKKLCVDEFQELGFELNLQYRDELDAPAKQAFLGQFLQQAITGNGLAFTGVEDFGFVCLARRGSVSEEQRGAVEWWLAKSSELSGFSVSPLQDAWYPDQPIHSPS
ncbi:YggL family protein [Pseudomonas knackmussii]|uniref:YggL 50S ribosome-binding family protein n=1 Tax=Pseudomonas knackmussii TaxID=65741 RepID=UPI003BB9D135